MSSEAITRNDLEAILNEIFNPLPLIDLYHPVGSYYETSDTTFDPNVSWGGTWVLELEGMVHISAGTGYVVNGATTNTSDGGSPYIQAHTHAFTQPNTPNHTHTHTYAGDASSALSGSNPSNLGSVVRMTTSSSTTGSWSTNSTGGGVACTGGAVGAVSGVTTGTAGNMPPYIIVNRWHRTA